MNELDYDDTYEMDLEEELMLQQEAEIAEDLEENIVSNAPKYASSKQIEAQFGGSGGSNGSSSASVVESDNDTKNTAVADEENNADSFKKKATVSSMFSCATDESGKVAVEEFKNGAGKGSGVVEELGQSMVTTNDATSDEIETTLTGDSADKTVEDKKTSNNKENEKVEVDADETFLDTTATTAPESKTVEKTKGDITSFDEVVASLDNFNTVMEKSLINVCERICADIADVDTSIKDMVKESVIHARDYLKSQVEGEVTKAIRTVEGVKSEISVLKKEILECKNTNKELKESMSQVLKEIEHKEMLVPQVINHSSPATEMALMKILAMSLGVDVKQIDELKEEEQAYEAGKKTRPDEGKHVKQNISMGEDEDEGLDSFVPNRCEPGVEKEEYENSRCTIENEAGIGIAMQQRETIDFQAEIAKMLEEGDIHPRTYFDTMAEQNEGDIDIDKLLSQASIGGPRLRTSVV